jgi:membrane carboxypeptidase/penicillin-binding protein
MSSMMADVINYGTAARARSIGFALPAAGKTGTTNEYMDVWFVGYTPSIVAGVWIGLDQPATIIRNGYSADLAVPLWAEFMKVATRGNKPAWFSPPAGVTTANVCRVSGRLPADGCFAGAGYDEEGGGRPFVYTEYFARGTQPTEFCHIHSRSIIEGLQATFGGSHEAPPPPPSAPVVAPPPSPTVQEPAVVASAEPEPEPKKKRGFWSRVFGIGRRDDKDGKDKRD